MASVSNIIRLKRPSPFGKKKAARAPGPVTALDVDGQTLRVAQGAPKGDGITITKVVAAPLDFAEGADRSDPVTIGKAIAKAMGALRLKPATVVMGIPRAQVVLRTLQLPVIEEIGELAAMVHLQVARDLPFRLDEAVVDFKVRRQYTPAAPPVAQGEKPEAAPAPRLEALVAAVKREVVDGVRQIAEAAGFKLSAIGLLPYANARCVEACHVTEGNEAFALVTLRPDEATIDVISEQMLLFSRGAAVKPGYDAEHPDPNSETPAPAAPQNPEEWAAEYASLATIEVVRSLHSFTGIEPDLPPNKVVVSGGTGHEEEVAAALSKRLGRNVPVLDPATALGLPAENRERASGAMTAIGLALGVNDPQGLPFDFLNPKKPAPPRDMARIRRLTIGAAIAALVIFTVILRGYLIAQRKRLAEEWAVKAADASKNLPIYKKMIVQSTTIAGWNAGRQNWMDHYAYLSAMLPASEEVYITSFAVGGNGTIRLGVQATSGETLAKLDKQMRAAGYDVKPLAITPGADRFGYEFRSTVELIAPAKMKIDLSKVKLPPARPGDDVSLDPKLGRGAGG